MGGVSTELLVAVQVLQDFGQAPESDNGVNRAMDKALSLFHKYKHAIIDTGTHQG